MVPAALNFALRVSLLGADNPSRRQFTRKLHPTDVPRTKANVYEGWLVKK